MCDACKKSFIELVPKKAAGEWLMTFYSHKDNASTPDSTAEFFRNESGKIEINFLGRGCNSGWKHFKRAPKVFVDTDLRGANPYVCCEIIDARNHLWVDEIEMNPELTKLALENEAMKILHEKDNHFLLRGAHSGELVKNISSWLSSNLRKKGCYVATAVYGSYDCPEVWTLRRYRDNTLAKTWYGRAFIRTYYAISPTLVKWFGNKNWFQNMWREKLNRMVKNLQEKGFDSTPYEDKNW